MPDNHNREDLARYRFEMAEEHLRSAKALLDIGNYKDSYVKTGKIQVEYSKALWLLQR